MLPIDGILLPDTMRRALAGTRTTDPVLPDPGRRPRRPVSGLLAPRPRRLDRTPATAAQPS